MPLDDYSGKTFVAYLDISGFKKLMDDGDRAETALDTLYQKGYEILRNQDDGCRVEGLFISDCGVLFARRDGKDRTNATECLKALLRIIQTVNKRMLENGFMLTTSIAFGKFRYQGKEEFKGINKTPLYGHAYVSAFLDNESGRPKIKPGQCRIMKRGLPKEVKDIIGQNECENDFKTVREEDNHYYYYWMCDNPNQIREINRKYEEAYNSKYERILEALEGSVNHQHSQSSPGL